MKKLNRTSVSNKQLQAMYTAMLRLRKFEETVGDLVSQQQIKTPCHLYIGQEAIAAGVCLALDKKDLVFSTHRSHGHYLAKGADMQCLMAELFGKKTGCSKGKGGSMHLVAPEVGFMGSSAIVAGTIPLAVGSALSLKMQKSKSVCAVFLGDGAVDEGIFYESLNFASLKRLPVIFICENNLYSSHLHISKRLADINICQKAQIFNMPGIEIDGNNVIDVFKASKKLIHRARHGLGPALIECLTYRWRGHVGPNLDLDKGLRSRKELDYWMSRCPIKRLENTMIKKGALKRERKAEIIKKIEKEVMRAVAFAKNSPVPEKKELYTDIFK